MDLADCLIKYNEHLNKLLQNPIMLEKFKKLSEYDRLGCFCEPNKNCHVDIIMYYLNHLGLNTPKRQCVKVKYLRKETNPKTGEHYDNLEEWCNNEKNCLCTRNGRVFIGSKKEENQRVYHYPKSDWCNPYKVK